MSPENSEKLRSCTIGLVLWASSFIIYQTTFISTPRLFSFPEAGSLDADVPEYAIALRGRPNETDMRKHLLYAPLGQALYRFADSARLLCGINQDTAALIFPGAAYGATSVVVAYCLFLRFLKRRRFAIAAAVGYAFTYSFWLLSSVAESYALTTLFVNLVLLFALKEGLEPGWRWCSGMAALIALSSLCDLRSVSLMIIPLYLIAFTPRLQWSRRIGFMCVITIGIFFLVATAYESYKCFSANKIFGIREMYNWIPQYRQKNISPHQLFDWRSMAYSLRIFLIETISPLYGENFVQNSLVIQRAHISLVCCLLAMFGVLILGSVRTICSRVSSCLSLRALLCWFIIYLAQLYVIFLRSALAHTPPIVFPLMLLVLPGVVRAWRPRRMGIPLMAAIVVVVLGNNFLVINEARLAWQRPDILLSPEDRVYLIPGEVERLRFLLQKGISLLTQPDRERLAKLERQPPSSLREEDEKELKKLRQRADENLPEAERRELTDIRGRLEEAARMASQ